MNEQQRAAREHTFSTDGDRVTADQPRGTAPDAPAMAGDGANWAGDTTIRETPGVCGGYPCVGHTRVSVRIVVNMYRATGHDLERTHAMLNMLTREQIQAALDYYAAHPARVDEDIERNARLGGAYGSGMAGLSQVPA